MCYAYDCIQLKTMNYILQVLVCIGRHNTTATTKSENELDSINISQKVSSQDALVAELKLLLESILSGKEDKVNPHLQPLFENIEDFAFLTETAVKLYQHNITFKSLLYIIQKRVCSKDDEHLVHTIADIIIKADLLEYLHFRGNNTYEDVNMFGKTLKELCIIFISKLDLDIASMCWLKYSGIKLSIGSNEIVDIMNSIPPNAKMGSIIMWLKNFVPYILEQNPFYIDLFVRWATERVFILEQSGYWPKIGIKFIEEIIVVLESSLKVIFVKPVSMDDLDTLKDRINYIKELKEKYKINLLLSELSSQNPNEVALIMLRRCYTEDLEAFLQDYLPRYATRHLFDTDDALTTFVESETASSGGVVDGSRLELILKAFRSPSNKLVCLLHVLKTLDVPWSPAMIKLAINAATSASKDFTASGPDRIIAQEIQKEINYANVKVVLKKYNFPLTCTDYTLVLHKLVGGTVIDLNDLKAITTVMSNYANYGNVLYINKCLEDNDSRSALDYFHNMPIKEKNILLKTIMLKYEQIVNGKLNCKVIERNYIDFMKGTHLLNEIQITNIDNLYHLKNSYSIELSMNNIYKEEICANQINSCTQNISPGCAGIVKRLIPSQTRSSSLMSLLRGVSAVHQVRNLVECLITSDRVENTSKDNIEMALSQFKDGKNASLLLDAFNIMVELLNKCNEEHLHYLLKQLAILNALIHANITVKNLTIAWKFNYVYLPISSGNAINEFIDYSVSEMTHKNKTLANLNRIHYLCDFIPFRIISNIVANSNHGELLAEDILVMRDEVAKKLLSKVVAAQEFDEVLTTVLLILVNSSDNLDKDYYMMEILRGQGESLSPKLTCYLSNPIIRRSLSFGTNLQEGNVVYPPKYILKSKFNINLSDIALPENTEETWDVKVILFYILKQHPFTSSERLIELCRALNVSTNDGLSLQLISLLSTWELKYKIFCDELGCRQIYIENDTSLLFRCLVIWENIRNKDFLKDVLNDFWKNGEVTLHGRTVSVNPYYYEVFLCIHRLIFGTPPDSKSVKEYYLLNYLKEYRRISAPKQYEFELFSVKGMFPEIGYYRLPFHLFMREDMWSNLKTEITLETYERWLPVVALLSLDADLQIAKDMICSNALKQTMTSRKLEGNDIDSKESEPWRLVSREEPLLRAAHRCVRHVANMEWAGACLFYVLQGCTRGADQVAAAHLCYQFAQRWAALQPGNRAVKQMERLHASLSTRHVLYKIEWACEEFVRLSTEPAQLIRALYLHPDFVNKIARHDLNRAANEIADKNNINISSIRIQILENFLDKATDDHKDKRAALHAKELITAKYILKATCPKMVAIYLSRIAFDDDSDYNKCKKMRALQCLMSVVDSDTAIKVTNKERDALWISLIELLSIVKLENIDMPWVVLTFTQNKYCALEQLLQNVEGNIEGLRTAASLACQFGNIKIIRNLIPLLLRSGLNEELIPLLLNVSSPPDSMIYTAWRAVILSPFQNADYPITERQKIKCLNAINLLPVCPIIKDEDLKELWKNCVRLKTYGLGCLILPYMTPQTRQSLTELQKIDRRNLIVCLKNLHADTYLVSGAMHVIEGMAVRAYKH